MDKNLEIEIVLCKYCKQIDDIENELKEIEKVIVPECPLKKNVFTITEYKEYETKKTAYDRSCFLKGVHKKRLEKRYNEIKSEIVRALPTSNTWFLLENNSIAIAHQTDDWPTSIGNIFIIKNPNISELKEVKHQIIN